MKYNQKRNIAIQRSSINPKFDKLSFTVILIEPETAGNIGAIARVMKNFDFERLIIFNPKNSDDIIKSHETEGYAMHGNEILQKAEIYRSKDIGDHLIDLRNYLNNFDLIMTTTAKGKKNTNLRRLGIFPEDISLPMSKKQIQIALLFGRESTGLTNEEIELSDVTIRIPTSDDYPTMNLSHASAIIFYELFKKTHDIAIGRGKKPVLIAEKEDRLLLYDFFRKNLQKLRFEHFTEERMNHAFKNVIERSFTSKKEIRLITGFFSKLHSILEDLNPFGE
ncbi:MAG: TrmJ/YjtD family RNA methyltransferase [Candidatus Lokiarchaeota archaeon]|nr:TrmJ/YjtD family RNA methyltransferase [Candidatus Lokiarchaeota archaeon]